MVFVLAAGEQRMRFFFSARVGAGVKRPRHCLMRGLDKLSFVFDLLGFSFLFFFNGNSKGLNGCY